MFTMVVSIFCRGGFSDVGSLVWGGIKFVLFFFENRVIERF